MNKPIQHLGSEEVKSSTSLVRDIWTLITGPVV